MILFLRKLLLVLCFTLLLFEINYSQNLNSYSTREYLSYNSDSDVNWMRTGISSSIILGSNAALWIHYDKNWYRNTQIKFHFKDDWYDYNLNMDKVGHVFGGMFLTQNYYKLFRWSDFSHSQAIWLSAGLTFAQLLQIEVFDAYDKYFGASWSDLGANTLGIIYGIAQLNYKSANMINLKLSHDINHLPFEKDIQKELITNYTYRTFWLTFHYHDLLPKSLQKYHPDWLGIAIGYGISNTFINGRYNIDKNGKGLGNQNYYLAIDIDLNRLFKPEKGTFLWQVLDIIGYLHIPMPTIQLSPNTKFHALYF